MNGPTQPEATQGGAGPGPLGRLRRARRRPLVEEPTQQELDALPLDKRLELVNQQRQSRHQNLNSVGILLGVAFTAASLVATALTLRTTQEGQITDRYTKAVEQLGSNKRDVRLGAIYALERIAADSERDRPTIIAVLAAFVREHDPAPEAKPPGEPDTDVDVHAALTVLGRRHDPPGQPTLDPPDTPVLDLHGIRNPNCQLQNANLREADMHKADLRQADFSDADLSGAELSGADLSNARLHDVDLRAAMSREADLDAADLSGADLRGANLLDGDLRQAWLVAADLRGAVLTGDLREADLREADLREADLRQADLRRALLADRGTRGADMHGTDLRGTDLREVQGMAADEIRKMAKTDATTRF